MPELTDEHIEGLFADLRADEIRQVRPPGTGAARSTVKRRRTVRSVVAGVAVLAVAGGVAAVGLNTARPDPTADLINAENHRVYSDALLTIRRDIAATRIGVTPADQGIIGREILRGNSTSVFEALAGTYEFKLSCVGAGQVDVEVRNGAAGASDAFDHDTATVALRSSVTCDGPGSVRAWTFPVMQGFVAISVEPGPEARDQSAFAFEAALSQPDQQRYQDVAADAVDALGGSAGTRMAGFLSDGEALSVHDDTAVAGRHRLYAACTGAGSVTFTVASVPPIVNGEQAETPAARVLAQRAVICGATPGTATLTFTGPDGGTVETSVRPDPDAAGRAAAAYRTVTD